MSASSSEQKIDKLIEQVNKLEDLLIKLDTKITEFATERHLVYINEAFKKQENEGVYEDDNVSVTSQKSNRTTSSIGSVKLPNKASITTAIKNIYFIDNEVLFNTVFGPEIYALFCTKIKEKKDTLITASSKKLSLPKVACFLYDLYFSPKSTEKLPVPDKVEYTKKLIAYDVKSFQDELNSVKNKSVSNLFTDTQVSA